VTRRCAALGGTTRPFAILAVAAVFSGCLGGDIYDEPVLRIGELHWAFVTPDVLQVNFTVTNDHEYRVPNFHETGRPQGLD
jgi:hypothetical protein